MIPCEVPVPRGARRRTEGVAAARTPARPPRRRGLPSRPRLRGGPWGRAPAALPPSGEEGTQAQLRPLTRQRGLRSQRPDPRGGRLSFGLFRRSESRSPQRPSSRQARRGRPRGGEGAAGAGARGPRLGRSEGGPGRGFANERRSSPQLTDQRAAIAPPTWSNESQQRALSDKAGTARTQRFRAARGAGASRGSDFKAARPDSVKGWRWRRGRGWSCGPHPHPIPTSETPTGVLPAVTPSWRPPLTHRARFPGGPRGPWARSPNPRPLTSARDASDWLP